MKINRETTGIVVQATAVLSSAAGIVIEVIYGAHFGFILITVGALACTIGTKLRGR